MKRSSGPDRVIKWDDEEEEVKEALEEEPSSLKQQLMEIAAAPTQTEPPPAPKHKAPVKPKVVKRPVPKGPSFLTRKPSKREVEEKPEVVEVKPPSPPPREETPPPPPRPPTPLPDFILRFALFDWFRARFTEPYETVPLFV